jgi:hypothetical protein
MWKFVIDPSTDLEEKGGSQRRFEPADSLQNHRNDFEAVAGDTQGDRFVGSLAAVSLT